MPLASALRRKALPVAALALLAGLAVIAALLSCASQSTQQQPAAAGTTSAAPAPAPKPTLATARPAAGLAQLVLYVREPQASPLPIEWVIRKIALNRADGSQVALPGGEVTFSASSLEMGAGGPLVQRLVMITDIEAGNYTGVTFFTREALYQDTGEALTSTASAANFVTAELPFSITPGVTKTLIAVVELAPAGAARPGFKFEPRVSIEGEPASLKGKLVLVTNEDSSNLSIVDRSLRRVVKNVSLATRPGATCADQRRNRMYIADQRAGVIYELDMINQHLLKATQLEIVDEPVHIQCVPTKDLLIVVNFGSDTIYLVDTFNLQVVDTLEVGDGPVDAVYSTYSDLAFVVNMMDNSLSVVNIESTPAVVQTSIQLELRPAGITIDDSMGWIYVTNSGSTDLTVLKMDTKMQSIGIERTFPIGVGATDIVFDQYGNRLFIAMTATNEILCVDPYTGIVIYSVRLPSRPGRLVFDPDEKTLYATVPAQDAVVVIDTITREIQNWIETGESPSSIEMRI